MDRIDAVVHLAIVRGYEGDYEEDEFNDLRFDINIKGIYNIFEAAYRASIKRMVHTSSLVIPWRIMSSPRDGGRCAGKSGWGRRLDEVPR